MWNLWPHGPPCGASGKNLPANAGDMRCRFDPCVRKIPWSQKWQPTLVFLPGESPWTEEPSGLQSIGLQRIRHDWTDLACMDCSLPGPSVLGILLAKILEWVAITFSRGSSQPKDQTWVSCIAGRFFTVWATKESHNWILSIFSHFLEDPLLIF